MKTLLALMLVGLASSFAQDSQSLAKLRWKDVSGQYTSFDEIKPILVNAGNGSVFLD
jgi:hypothetical protein